MLKQKKVSPNTYHKKKLSLEVWVNNERDKIDKQKQDFKNVFQNTIEIINNTNKNKDRIKQILNRSQSKRPGIWSDYGDSLKSFDSKVSDKNMSMHMNHLKGLAYASNDQSINSLIFSGDKANLNEDSLENKSSGLYDIKQSLKNKLKDYSKSYKRVSKELEIDPKKDIGDEPQETVKIEIINKPDTSLPPTKLINAQEEQSKGEDYKSEENEEEKRSNIIDELDQKLEDENFNTQESGQANSPQYETTLDAKINDFDSSNSSYSPETPKEHIEESDTEQNISDGTKHISIKNISAEPLKKTSAIEDINVQSKWLESYLNKEENKTDILNAKNTEGDEKPQPNFQIIYDEEDPGKQTPEGILDEPIGVQMQENQPPSKNEDSFTPRGSMSHTYEDGEHDIPVIAYSDEDNDSQTSSFKRKTVGKPSDDQDSDMISDSYEEVDLKNSDLITKNTPSLTNEDCLQKEKQSDIITNDLFYEILADIITDPVPKRDLSIFTLQPQVSKRQLVDPLKRK